MTREQFLQYIREQVALYSSQRAAAHAWGMAPQYLGEILRGTRPPGPSILRALGYVRRETYEVKERKDDYVTSVS